MTCVIGPNAFPLSLLRTKHKTEPANQMRHYYLHDLHRTITCTQTHMLDYYFFFPRPYPNCASISSSIDVNVTKPQSQFPLLFSTGCSSVSMSLSLYTFTDLTPMSLHLPAVILLYTLHRTHAKLWPQNRICSHLKWTPFIFRSQTRCFPGWLWRSTAAVRNDVSLDMITAVYLQWKTSMFLLRVH